MRPCIKTGSFPSSRYGRKGKDAEGRTKTEEKEKTLGSNVGQIEEGKTALSPYQKKRKEESRKRGGGKAGSHHLHEEGNRGPRSLLYFAEKKKGGRRAKGGGR